MKKKRASKLGSLLDRFERHVVRREGCWGWTGSRTKGGYSRIPFDSKHVYAHRVAYEIANGRIRKGLEIDHLCRNPGCVNPAHLEAVSHRENGVRGRGVASRAKATHCKRGHPFDASNTYRVGKNHRRCKACTLARNEASRIKGATQVQRSPENAATPPEPQSGATSLNPSTATPCTDT